MFTWLKNDTIFICLPVVSELGNKTPAISAILNPQTDGRMSLFHSGLLQSIRWNSKWDF